MSIERRGRIPELVRIGEQRRPDVRWIDIAESISPLPAPPPGRSRESCISAEQETDIESPRVASGSPRSMRVWFLVVSALVAVIFIGCRALFFKCSGYAPEFAPTWISSIEVNAKNDNYVGQHPNVPESLTWHVFESGTLGQSTAVQVGHSNLDHYLYYSSILHTKRYSWTGFLFWRKFPLAVFKTSGKSELITIIYAERPDVLEIGFKDVHDNEMKITLPVAQGWAGYRIPFTEFESIDFDRIELFLIAHTRGVGSSDANTFEVALFDFR